MKAITAAWGAFNNFVTLLAKLFAYVGAAALLLSILVIAREALGRYFFDAPTSYAYPLVSVLVVVILYCGIGYTASTDGHVSSDVIYGRLPARGKAVIDIISDLAAGVLGALLLRESLGQVERSMAVDSKLGDLFGAPTAAAQSFVVLGAAVLLLVAIAKLPIHIGRLVFGAPPPQPDLAEEDALVGGGV